MDSRFFAYVALAFVMLLIYETWTRDYGSPFFGNGSQQSPATEANVDSEQNPNSTSGEDVPAVPKEKPIPTAIETKSIEEKQTIVYVETDVLSLAINTQGGTIVKADLLQYPVSVKQPDQPTELLMENEKIYVAQSGLQSADQAAPDHYAIYKTEQQNYNIANADTLQIPLVWVDASGIKVTKTFTLTRGSYLIKIDHKVENQSQTPWLGSQYRQLQRNFAETKKNRFIYTYTGGVIYSDEDKYEKIKFDEIVEEPLNRSFANGWAAFIQHYFLSAWVPVETEINRYYSQAIPTTTGYRYILGLSSPVQEIQPGQIAEFSSQLFVGPKLQEQLKEVKKSLVLTVDYGLLTFLSEPLFWLLNKIYTVVGNWGWAIILVVIIIKLIFYKLAEASYRSMARMRQVQPKMLKIKERYANDRQRQGQAMMELYKQEKINPLGGCLPILVQIPVFIALYWVLLESVEMRQAPFILWIKDLSIKDPFYVLPIIMGVTMYIQQKLNPAPIDPVQAKVFMMLPFIFTFFFAFFPAGLVLYWVVNNLLTILQQWIITKRVMQSAA